MDIPPTDIAVTDSGPAAAPVRAAWRQLHVLVVDDVDMNRDIAARFLDLGGHRASCAATGQAAVEAVAAGAFDVVLMDVQMPGMNGLEATRLIRALPAPAGRVPVLALTAQAFQEQIELCREAGMNEHISKPFEQPALVAAVERIAAAQVALVSRQSAEATAQPGGLRVLDPLAYAAMAETLQPAGLQTHLRRLIERAGALREALRGPAIVARAGELSGMAHGLAGSAGVFGFGRLAESGHRFAFAAEFATPQIVPLAEDLCGALDASIAAMRELLY